MVVYQHHGLISQFLLASYMDEQMVRGTCKVLLLVQNSMRRATAEACRALSTIHMILDTPIVDMRTLRFNVMNVQRLRDCPMDMHNLPIIPFTTSVRFFIYLSRIISQDDDTFQRNVDSDEEPCEAEIWARTTYAQIQWMFEEYMKYVWEPRQNIPTQPHATPSDPRIDHNSQSIAQWTTTMIHQSIRQFDRLETYVQQEVSYRMYKQRLHEVTCEQMVQQLQEIDQDVINLTSSTRLFTEIRKEYIKARKSN